jgi:NAD(P)-dependent dehydrogenase (short-subunit alcohol dehydrogenase family)
MSTDNKSPIKGEPVSMKNLTSKKAIVLGGTSGIGLAIVKALATEGVSVVAGSRREVQPSSIDNVQIEQIDVLDRDGLETLFAKHAPFDILVNAATGGARASGPFLEMDLDGFQGSFAKLWGYTNSVRIGAHHMSDDGTIVLISGYPARWCAPGMSAIGTVGNAVEGFVRAIAPEISPRRINVVAPGVIDTPMFAQEGGARDEFLTESTKGQAIPRAGKPEEVADGVMFVIKNSFVTGTTVDVDGGALLPRV